VDVVAIMEALAEQGITVLFKADAERMAERRKPWTFVGSGAPLRDDVLVRTDAASVEQCLEACRPNWACRCPSDDSGHPDLTCRLTGYGNWGRIGSRFPQPP
jgi:hypothetical protein